MNCFKCASWKSAEKEIFREGVLKFKGRDGGRPESSLPIHCVAQWNVGEVRWCNGSGMIVEPVRSSNFNSLSPRHFKWPFVSADSSKCPAGEANWIYCPLSCRWMKQHVLWPDLLFNWEVTVLMSLYAVNYYYFLLHIFLISLAAVLHPKLVCVVFLLLFPVHSQNKTYDECFSWMEPSESMEWS